MLTNGQKKALHSAARQAGIGEEHRRTVQRNLGGFHSAADRTASRAGFIAVMAFYERLCGGTLHGCTAGYWQGQDAGENPTAALGYRVIQEARALGMDKASLDGFLAGPHMSSGLYATVEDAPAYWLRRCLEALKAMRARRERRAI